jgi:UPF0755 protein
MKFSVLSVFKTVFLFVLLVAVGIGGYSLYKRLPSILDQFSPRPGAAKLSPGKDVMVTIPKGASLSKVGSILEEHGVISSPLVFKVVAMIRGETRKIQAGEYALKSGSDAGEVLDLLISGRTLMFPFTVPEGYTIFQIADLFQQWGLMPQNEFLKLARDKAFMKELGVEADSLEGYLFPDTYFLTASEKGDGRLLIRRMVKRFLEVYDKHVRPTAEMFRWDMNQVLTLASLIEKEAKESEHALVSAVFHNRLRKGMRLQCDPTVIYGLKPMGAKITREDLERNHPYNTYVHSGLPPGPIANPGKASLVASVKPADVDYLYFVARNDGTHQFSTTLQEHNKWVNLFQRQPRNMTR